MLLRMRCTEFSIRFHVQKIRKCRANFIEDLPIAEGNLVVMDGFVAQIATETVGLVCSLCGKEKNQAHLPSP